MKNLLLIIVLFLGFNTIAQDRENKFATYVYTEPGAYDDGFNIGAGVEYQMNYLYFGAQVFTFPDLNGTTYNHIGGSIGLNIHSYTNEWRYYTGVVLANIVGERVGGVFGVEAGIDFIIPNTNLYIGANISALSRGDGAFEEDYEPQTSKNHWVNNVGTKIGFKF